MRIALCLSGHLRNYCINYTKFLNNTDIFLCTWDSGFDTSVFKDYRVFDFNLFQSIHKFKYSTIEPYAQYTHPHKGRKGWDSYSNFFLQYQCHLLRKEYEAKHNVKYDMVIRFRPDYKFYFDTLPVLDGGTLYFPENSNFHGVTDNLVIGTSELMDRFMLLYLVMDTYVSLEKCNWINEQLVSHHVKKLGLKHEKVNGLLYLGCDNVPPGGDQILTPEQLHKIKSKVLI